MFQLCMYGNGFIWNDVYNMPVYLRTFYLKQLNEHYEEQAKARQKANQRFKK